MIYFAFFVMLRIAIGSKYNTNRCIVLKLKVNFIEFTIDAGIHHINNIIFHTWKNDLSLRITKSGIVL